jgi:flagellar basal-body rod protein FlgB
MANFRITDRTFAVLQKSLDLRQTQQQVIAANVANADTPGYRARKLSFEEDLRKAIAQPEPQIRQSHPKHFPIGNAGVSAVQGTISQVPDKNPMGDGNSVSLDDEMFDLAESQLLYEAGAQMLKKKLTMLKFAASDGR